MKENKTIHASSDEPQMPQGLGEFEHSHKKPRSLMIAMLILVVLASAAFGALLTAGRQDARIRDLKRENDFLKAKLELYSATVDSIYHMLDSLQIKAESPSDTPAFSGGASEYQVVELEPKLKARLRASDEALVSIMQDLSAYFEDYSSGEIYISNDLDAIPGIYPTFGRISDTWGRRIHPITGQLEFHYGLDISNVSGTPIYAAASGKVAYADYDSGYGKRIIIDHGNGYRTLYAHLYSHQVYKGDIVQKGQIIALMGSTGLSTGPHLHYEVQYNERKVNPANFLNRVDTYAMY